MVGLVPSGEQWTIKSGDHRAVLVEVGGGLRGYDVAEVEVVDGYAEGEIPPGGAGQILAPWPNRIRDGRYSFGGSAYQLALSEPTRHNAAHGLVRWSRWNLLDTREDELVLGFDLPPTPGYPWPLRFRTVWSVGPDGLRAAHEVTNLGEAAAPFGFAAHPYLRVPGGSVEDTRLRVPGRSRLLTDGRLLPIGAARVGGGEYDFTSPRQIGRLQLDTAFGDVIREPDGGSAVELSTADGRGVRIWADEAFSWWQVFTGDTLGGARHRRSVAVEPMTCPPDAFRSGRDLTILEPGGTWRGSWGITRLA
jgi:aldose 1-epimerase